MNTSEKLHSLIGEEVYVNVKTKPFYGETMIEELRSPVDHVWLQVTLRGTLRMTMEGQERFYVTPGDNPFIVDFPLSKVVAVTLKTKNIHVEF